MAAGRPTALGGDFLHEPTRTLIEIDEEQHFTSARLTTLGLYPESLPLGFSLNDYKTLCRKHRLKSDRYRAAKEARGFGPGGRDAVRPGSRRREHDPPLLRRPRDPRVECAEAAVADIPRPAVPPAELVICADFRIGEEIVRTVSMVARFDTARELTLDELQIELTYPRGVAAERFFRERASSACHTAQGAGL